MRIGSAAVNLSLLLAALVVAILSAEVAVSALYGRDFTRPVRPKAFMEYDSLLGWRKIPNAEGWLVTREYEVFESINSKGLRGPDRPYEKPHGKYRVLLLGDSFTEGYTAALDESVAHVLEQELNSDGSECFEVINGATNGYSTDQELLFFESEGVKYQPDLTVLMFYMNDVHKHNEPTGCTACRVPISKPLFQLSDAGLELTNVPPPKPDSKATDSTSLFGSPQDGFESDPNGGLRAQLKRIKFWLVQHSALYNVLKDNHLLRAAAIKLGVAEKPGGAIPHVYFVWAIEYPPDYREAWRITDALIGRLDAGTAAANSKLLICYVPERISVYADAWEATQRKFGLASEHFDPERDDRELESICKAYAIDCIFPVTRFRTEARRLSSEGRGLYHVRDGHWNGYGQRLAGRILAEYVRGGTIRNDCTEGAYSLETVAQ